MPAVTQAEMEETSVNVPLGKEKPGAIESQAATLAPDAALVVPVGHVRTTALELYTPADAL